MTGAMVCPKCAEDVTAQVSRKAQTGWLNGRPKNPCELRIMAVCSRGHYSEHTTTYEPKA